MTKQQKLLAGILGLGGLALTVDRLMVGYDATGPGSASAMVVAVPQSANAVAATVAQAGQQLQMVTERRHALAEQLTTLSDEHSFALADLVDAFDPSAAWLNADSQDATPVAAAPKVSPIDSFQRQHRLEAVFAGGAHQFAVINGQRLSPGQRLDNGAILRRVDQRAAVFELEGQMVELTLAVGHRK